MLTLTVEPVMSSGEADALAGTLLDDSSFHTLITEDADVYKPNGEPLLKFRKNVIPKRVIPSAFDGLKAAATTTFNRGLAAGTAQDEELVKLNDGKRRFVKAKGSPRLRLVKEDGTLSNTFMAKPVESGIVGYFDRNARMPYCRLTAFNLNKPEKFKKALPFIREVDSVFKAALPERYAAQAEVVEETSEDFLIHGTVFTTVTVNMNFRTAVHKDAGDLKQGFGVLSAIRAGTFDGCYFCFPEYGVAVDMQTADVLLGDVHEWHGNTPLVGKPGTYERLSLVFYYREGMAQCGTAEEELKRVQTRERGTKLNA